MARSIAWKIQRGGQLEARCAAPWPCRAVNGARAMVGPCHCAAKSGGRWQSKSMPEGPSAFPPTLRSAVEGLLNQLPVTVEAGAVGGEPRPGALHVGAEGLGQAPEAAAMVQLPKVGDLMGDDIVDHEAGRQNQAPGE